LVVADDLSWELLSVVSRLNRWATRNAHVAEPIAGLRLLAVLDEQGSSRIGDLARLDNCSQPTMTTQVQRLHEAGWITREADASDARAVRISLSPAGRVELDRARRARASVLQPRLAKLTVRQRSALGEAVAILDGLMADQAGSTGNVLSGRGSARPASQPPGKASSTLGAGRT
jgi:DNA-binding MarR family transcriptional regulator